MLELQLQVDPFVLSKLYDGFDVVTLEDVVSVMMYSLQLRKLQYHHSRITCSNGHNAIICNIGHFTTMVYGWIGSNGRTW